jgi:hypothetical protein
VVLGSLRDFRRAALSVHPQSDARAVALLSVNCTNDAEPMRVA